MLIIENKTVYRIDGDKAGEVMFEFTDEVQKIEDRSMALMEASYTDEDGDVLVSSEYHADIILRRMRREDPELRKRFYTIYQRMWDALKEELLTTGGDISSHQIDMKPEDVADNIHGEHGLAYSLDDRVLIECADCQVRADVSLAFFEEVARVQKKANHDEVVGPEDFDRLLDMMPDIAEGYPPMIIALHVNGGTALIGPKDTTPEFDDDLPMPTHVAKRILN